MRRMSKRMTRTRRQGLQDEDAGAPGRGRQEHQGAVPSYRIGATDVIRGIGRRCCRALGMLAGSKHHLVGAPPHVGPTWVARGSHMGRTRRSVQILGLKAALRELEEPSCHRTLRGVGGDVWVGVGSVLELAARARVKFFLFYFSRIGYAPYHSKKRKKQLTQNRVRARTPLCFCLRSPPWGGRPSRFRVRARGENILFFLTL